MQAVFPLIAHPVSARIASVLSWIPALRGAVYEILGAQFVQRHVCRLRPAPLGLFRMLAGMNREIYETLWGPSEFFAPGLLKNWDIRPRLAQIRVPTLIVSGRHDEATPAQMAILHQGIADSQWIVLQKSAHCAMWEEPDEFRAALLGFLDRVEATIGP
jgi:proline-specific peptidase